MDRFLRHSRPDITQRSFIENAVENELDRQGAPPEPTEGDQHASSTSSAAGTGA
jgi:hypothetical protein